MDVRREQLRAAERRVDDAPLLDEAVDEVVDLHVLLVTKHSVLNVVVPRLHVLRAGGRVGATREERPLVYRRADLPLVVEVLKEEGQVVEVDLTS